MKIQGTIQTFIKQEAHVQQISPRKIKDELTRSQRSGGHIGFLIRLKVTKLVSTLPQIFVPCFIMYRLEKFKMSRPIRGSGGHTRFLIDPKNNISLTQIFVQFL